MQTVTVDPGLLGTGYAVWGSVDAPLHSGVLKVPSGLSKKLYWTDRCFFLADKFRTLLLELTVPYSEIYIEYPKFFQSATGLASAGSGDVFKLTFLVGVLAQTVRENDRIFKELPVNIWKGNLPKEVIIGRIKQRLGVEYGNHVADAVGMGLFLRGELNVSGMVVKQEGEGAPRFVLRGKRREGDGDRP